MKSFLLKVELHNDTVPNDYNNLHIALYNVGFYRTILLADGHWYDLPHAEYVYNSDDNLNYVYNFVVGTIEATIPGIVKATQIVRPSHRKSYSITLAESDYDTTASVFKTKHILFKANQHSVLPPGVTLN